MYGNRFLRKDRVPGCLIHIASVPAGCSQYSYSYISPQTQRNFYIHHINYLKCKSTETMVKSDYKIYYAPVPVSIVRVRSSPLHKEDVSRNVITGGLPWNT